MSLFYFTSYVLNMFRKLIYPSSGACDYSVELLYLFVFIIRVRTSCYAVSPAVHISDINTFKAMHYVYFGGNTSNSGKIFSIQKKTFRITAGAQHGNFM